MFIKEKYINNRFCWFSLQIGCYGMLKMKDTMKRQSILILVVNVLSFMLCYAMQVKVVYEGKRAPPFQSLNN